MTTFMNPQERRLYLAGVSLFLFGLALGFAVPAFPDKHAVLGAHLTALGSGTFLIVMGVIWQKLSAASRSSSVVAHLLWISFYILQAGLTLDATKLNVPAGAPLESSPSTTHAIAGLLNIVGGILMFVAVAATLVFLVKSKSPDNS